MGELGLSSLNVMVMCDDALAAISGTFAGHTQLPHNVISRCRESDIGVSSKENDEKMNRRLRFDSAFRSYAAPGRT
jgi:hypothetical protein